ncbi:MAG: cytochrome c, partial [Anaerolineales bacterium]|nr:cytochrome c [Anaerolineales bacterium]
GAAEVPTTVPGDEISQGAPEDTDTDTAEGHDDDTDADTAPDSDADHDTDEAAASIDAADIFSQRCSGCHGEDRGGGRGPALLPDVLTKDPTSYKNTITNGSGPMPVWGNRLSTDEINALVEYILSEAQ